MDIEIGSDGEIISLDGIGEVDYSSPDDENYEEEFNATLQAIKENNAGTKGLDQNGDRHYIRNMTDSNWVELGRDIANNTHLNEAGLYGGALNDHKMSFLFRGLKRSSSIAKMELHNNHLSIAGVRTMEPFLLNANNLRVLNIQSNNLQSEGFNFLLRALRNCPIEELCCNGCGIQSIEIDSQHKPKNLKTLLLYSNSINSDGCLGLAKLLQGGDATLNYLFLENNNIDNEGVEILTNALKNNTSLKELHLSRNYGIKKLGRIMLLKVVNDISSIESTLQSNYTLTNVKFSMSGVSMYIKIQKLIDAACECNKQCDLQTTNLRESNPGAAGRMKVIQTQLHSEKRAKLEELQGVTSSVFSEIDPLHLPEVLALVGSHHGQGELFVALRSSIAGVISTVNRKECLKQEKGYHHAIIAEHSARVEAIDAEIAAIEAAEGRVVHVGSDCNSNKKRRV